MSYCVFITVHVTPSVAGVQEFCVIDLVRVQRASGPLRFLKARTEKIDRGDRFRNM